MTSLASSKTNTEYCQPMRLSLPHSLLYMYVYTFSKIDLLIDDYLRVNTDVPHRKKQQQQQQRQF